MVDVFNDDYLDEHSGGGNWIDLPALQWLGKQAPRRLWVSDMKVRWCVMVQVKKIFTSNV